MPFENNQASGSPGSDNPLFGLFLPIGGPSVAYESCISSHSNVIRTPLIAVSIHQNSCKDVWKQHLASTSVTLIHCCSIGYCRILGNLIAFSPSCLYRPLSELNSRALSVMIDTESHPGCSEKILQVSISIRAGTAIFHLLGLIP